MGRFIPQKIMDPWSKRPVFPSAFFLCIPAKRSFFPYVTKLRIKLRLKLRFEKMLSDSSIFGQVQLTPFSNHFKGHYPITGLDMHHHNNIVVYIWAFISFNMNNSNLEI